MSGKLIFVILQAALIQSAFTQCINRTPATPSCLPISITDSAGLTPTTAGFDAYEYSFLASIESPIIIGPLPITSISFIPLEGIEVESENSYEGYLNVAGDLPFLGTVFIDGVLPSGGVGTIKHACGSPARITKVNLGLNNRGYGPAGYKGLIYSGTSALAGGIGYSTASSNAGFGGYGRTRDSYGIAAIGNLGAGGFDASTANGVYGIAGNPGASRYAEVSSANSGVAGLGEGNVMVAGQLPVSGETVVQGLVPIAGAVAFNGGIPARGTVSIKAFCSCGCDGSY